MKTLMAIRLSLEFAMLVTVVTGAAAQVPVPWNEYESFWNNPEAVKNLNLTNEQRQAMNKLLEKANEQFLLGIRSELTPEQWKQMQSLHTNHSEAAAQMGLLGPDAQRVASALRIGRVAAQNYMILINRMLVSGAAAGAQRLAMIRGTTNDPCKDASDAAIWAAPNLDSTQLRFTVTLEGISYAGNTCPAALAHLKQEQPAMLTATYPCAVTSQGVDLAPDCKLSSAVTMYVY